MLLFIRSLIFKIAYYILVSIMCLGIVATWFFGVEVSLMWPRFTGWALIKALKYIAGVEVIVEGELPRNYPCIIASKHQSSLETFLFHHILKRPCYVFKKELTYIPFMGWALAATKNIPIKRDEGVKSIITMLNSSEEILMKDKRCLIIFPEGTRYPVGEKPVYHSGVAMFYKKFPDIPVIPVALNSGLFQPKKGFLVRPGKLVFEFLPAIPTGLSKEEFMA
jgi:1-acyl-sn-glycerol-3-phosphate acyltransferase